MRSAAVKRGPQLATLVDEVPRGADWIHEIKFDGYRILCAIDGKKVRLSSRSGKDWTAQFAPIAAAARKLKVKRAVLDGEVVSLSRSGTASFQDLQNSMSSGKGRLAYYAFDLISLEGEELAPLPLVERKAMLRKLLGRQGKTAVIRYTEHVAGRGQELYDQACRADLEGIISKRGDRAYVPGRGDDWVKVKCHKEQEFVIGGWTDPQGARSGFGALLLGVHDPTGKLRYAGKVGTGFTEQSLDDLAERLGELERRTSPFTGGPRVGARGVHFVDPELVCQIRFSEWTADNHLRHPAFAGLREDKAPRAVTREKERHLRAVPAPARREPRAPRPKLADGPPAVAGIPLTHPHRVLYAAQGITKHELALYAEAVAEHMLPHVAGRPLTLVRCPEGQGKPCFFQKHAMDSIPKAVHRIDVKEARGKGEYLMVDSVEGLVGLAQVGALELHAWGSHIEDLEHPDRLVIDLDPAPGLPWKRVVEGTRRVRDLFRALGLASWLKTTGGKGLHVVVPLAPGTANWEDFKEFSRLFAKRLAAEEPDRYIATAALDQRGGKIFLDWLRNGRGATAIVPYSTRARPGATVSMPIPWDALTEVRPDTFMLRSALKHLELRRKDPWADMAKSKQKLTAEMWKKLKER